MNIIAHDIVSEIHRSKQKNISNNFISIKDTFLVCLYEVKKCLCDTPGASAHALVRDQNVQFCA